MNGINKRPERRKVEEINTCTVFQSITSDTIYMSEVSIGELIFGAEISANPTVIHQRIKDFRRMVTTVYLDEVCWEIFGQTKAVLEQAGICVTDFDLLIACIAKRYGAIFVSNDRVFDNLPVSFQVENWAI